MVRAGALILMCGLAVSLMTDSAEAHGPSHHFHHLHHLHHRGAWRIRVRTACQGDRLTIGCHRGYRVHVLAAFYGRASGRICPAVLGRHHGPHKRVSRCRARGTRGRVRHQCEGRPSCHLSAISRVFGNPCPRGVRKYLRVMYACRFHDCKRVVRLQAKLRRLISRYGRLARTSYGYWRRRHYLHRRHRLLRKLNHIRRRFHFCFKCRRNCTHIRKLLARLKRAEVRIRKLLSRVLAKRKSHNHRMRWRANRWFLKRKLSYLGARQRILRHRLRKCTRVCHY